MRPLRFATLALIAAVVAFASCRTTSEECETYCASVADQLERCDLLVSETDFDLEDCYERTADVESETCAEVTTQLEDADCEAVRDSFCPDPALACPTDCFGGCCVDTDCPIDRPACDFGTCKTCTEDTAAQYCATKSCYLEECVECTEETVSLACAPGEGCDSHHCRKTCATDPDCGAFRRCSVGFCSEPVGTPCVDGDPSSCGIGGQCESTTASGGVVAPYCTIFCSEPADCPTGYTCPESGGIYCLQT